MSNKTERTPTEFPSQEQAKHPGLEHEMKPEPAYDAPWYKGSGKLQDKVALITGGDSGIGRSVAILFAREGCDVAISYLDEHKDAQLTKSLVEKEGRKCMIIPGDISNSSHCKQMVEQVAQQFGKIDILVNNAAMQTEQENFEDITEDQLDKTFKTNIYSFFWISQAALKHMKEGSSIINTTSVNAYKGHKTLIDYTSTKGAIVAFTYALASSLVEKGIRVNGVAPGPIWTPLIPSSFDAEHVKKFGQNCPMGRAGQPEECATCYVFLASRDASYISGQVLHPNGGYIIHG
jgi:NAD(P)-dependent dehydrogenase (short-subunit alcohol dehydrogenase family)